MAKSCSFLGIGITNVFQNFIWRSNFLQFTVKKTALHKSLTIWPQLVRTYSAVYCTLGAKRVRAPLSNDTAENRPVCIRKQSSTLFAGIYYSRLAKPARLQLAAGIALLPPPPPPPGAHAYEVACEVNTVINCICNLYKYICSTSREIYKALMLIKIHRTLLQYVFSFQNINNYIYVCYCKNL